MKNFLDNISLLETGDSELIRSLQSLGYAEEFNTNEWESPIGMEMKFPHRNQHFSKENQNNLHK